MARVRKVLSYRTLCPDCGRNDMFLDALFYSDGSIVIDESCYCGHLDSRVYEKEERDQAFLYLEGLDEIINDPLY